MTAADIQTVEELKNIFKQQYNDFISIENVRWEAVCTCGQGHNFTSDILRFNFDIKLEGNVETRTVVVKRLPQSMQSSPYITKLFANECFAYETVLPVLESFRRNHGLSDPLPYPLCHRAKSDEIIMEDLEAVGFLVQNSKEGLNFEQLSKVMEKLAQLHSTSLALRQLQPDKYKLNINEVVYVNENQESLGEIWENSLRYAAACCKGKVRPKVIQQLESYGNTILQRIMNITSSSLEDTFQVICHGDLWNNNVLFKYANEEVEDVRFLDLQAMRYGSCVLDLLHIICSSSCALGHSFTPLIHHYYCHLSQQLENYLGCVCPSLEDLYQEIKKKSVYGVLIGVLMIPAAFSNPNTNLTMDDLIGEDNLGNWFELYGQSCQERIVDLVSSMDDLGYI